MISFLAEFPDILNSGKPIMETPISIAAARAFNTVGTATLVIPDFIDRRSFRRNTRMRLWRRGLDGTASLFGDTNWFLRKIIHNYTSQTYTVEFEDALCLLQFRKVAYTSETPYADKTLEEFGLIVPNDSLRIDNMMRQYVRENYSTLALDDARDNPRIIVEANRNIGPHGELKASWQTLGDVLSGLADQSAEKGLELFYDFVPQTDDTFLFKVWDKVRRVDRGSDSFSILTLSEELNHLSDVEEVEDYSDIGTYVYMLGYDSGPSQIIVEVSDDAAIESDPFGRIEFTETAPDVDRLSVLGDYGQAALRGKRAKRTVSAQVVEGTGIVYGRDYSFGDRVLIHVGTRKYNCHVRAVSTRWEAGIEELDVRLDGYQDDAFPTFLLPRIHNIAPIVDAGDDAGVELPTLANLVGSVTDDNLPDPPNAVTVTWTKVSGPGTVTFVDEHAAITNASFSESGTYVLRLTASDSSLIATDEVEITVTDPEEEPTPPDYGLTPTQEAVVGISTFFLYRTEDFQTDSGSGGPTWDRKDLLPVDPEVTFDQNLCSVVDPFSPGYNGGIDSVDAFFVTEKYICKVSDMFGTTPSTSVLYTFPYSIRDGGSSGRKFRVIGASFGRYFETETDNPWLIVVSHYANSTNRPGTWVNYSLNAGQTWSAEIQVNNFYLSGEVDGLVHPPMLFMSPRVPGYAFISAYKTTASPSPDVGDFQTFDWGATWTEFTGNPVENPSEPLPIWAIWRDGSSLDVRGVGTTLQTTVQAEEIGAVGGVDEDGLYIILAPPVNAARIVVEVDYEATNVEVGLSSSAGATITIGTSGGTSETDDEAFSSPPDNSFVIGSFTVEWTFGGGDWPVNRTSIISSPPGAPTSAGARIRMFCQANAAGGGSPEASIILTLSLRVVEIELDGGLTYEPAPLTTAVDTGVRNASGVHVPWQDNADEAIVYHNQSSNLTGGILNNKTIRISNGEAEDISPSDGSRTYGPFCSIFSIRAFDSDRQFVVMGGLGGEIGETTLVGAWVSDDAGDTWTEIVTPFPYSQSVMGLHTAFSGTDSDVIYVWGGLSDDRPVIEFTDDFGSTLDDRSGNLPALADVGFGAVHFIAIAGGPPP